MMSIPGSLGSLPLQAGQEPQISRPKLGVFFGALSMASALGAVASYVAMGLSLPPIGLAVLAIFAFFVMKECKPKPASKEQELPRPDVVLSGIRRRQHNQHRVSHPFPKDNVVRPVVSQAPRQSKNPAAAAGKVVELMNQLKVRPVASLDDALGQFEQIIQNCEQVLHLDGEPVEAQTTTRFEVRIVKEKLLAVVGRLEVQDCAPQEKTRFEGLKERLQNLQVEPQAMTGTSSS
ncbi:MAG: hypothetical protein ACOYKZ_05965 [Chlamydiia bacterium]